jgi:hypothetical protein
MAGFDRAMDYEVCRFYAAANDHRDYVLDTLLPKHGLDVNS